MISLIVRYKIMPSSHAVGMTHVLATSWSLMMILVRDVVMVRDVVTVDLSWYINQITLFANLAPSCRFVRRLPLFQVTTNNTKPNENLSKLKMDFPRPSKSSDF